MLFCYVFLLFFVRKTSRSRQKSRNSFRFCTIRCRHFFHHKRHRTSESGKDLYSVPETDSALRTLNLKEPDIRVDDGCPKPENIRKSSGYSVICPQNSISGIPLSAKRMNLKGRSAVNSLITGSSSTGAAPSTIRITVAAATSMPPSSVLIFAF